MARHSCKKQKMLKLVNALDESYKTCNVSEKSNKNNIKDYLNLCRNFEMHITEFQNSWKYTLQENLVFYKINISNQPKIIVSIKIDKDLKVDVFTEHGKVAKKHIESLLNSQILKNWSQLKKLLRHFDEENFGNYVSIKYNLTQSLKKLKSCETIISAKGDTFSLEPKLKFLQNQIDALLRNKYTPYTILLAYSIYLKSSSCYKYIQSLDVIVLPNEKDLLQYISETDKITEEKSEG